MASRLWLKERFEQAGLETEIDGVAVVFGRSRNPGPALLLGSHFIYNATGAINDSALSTMSLVCNLTRQLAAGCKGTSPEVHATVTGSAPQGPEAVT